MLSHSVILLVAALLAVALPAALAAYQINVLSQELQVSRTICDVAVTEDITYHFDDATSQLTRVLYLGKGVEIEFESLNSMDNQATLTSKKVEGNTYVIEWTFPEQAPGTSKMFELSYKVKDLMRVSGTTNNTFYWHVFSDKEAATRVVDLRVNAIFLFDVSTSLYSEPAFDNITYSSTESATHVSWDAEWIDKGTNWTLSFDFPISVADLGSCLDVDSIRSSEPPLWLAILVLATVLVILAVIVVAIVIAVVSQILHNRAVQHGGSPQPSPITTLDTTATRPTTDVFDPTATPQQPPPSSQAV